MMRRIIFSYFFHFFRKKSARPQEAAHFAAGLPQAILHRFIVDVQVVGYVGRLHAVVEVKTVDVGSGLRHALQAALNMGHGVAGKDGRLGTVVVGHGGKGMTLVGPLMGQAAVVVNQKMAGHGIDEAAQRGLADGPAVVGEQAQEEVLHHVFGQGGVVGTKAAAQKAEQLATVLAIVLFYQLLVTHSIYFPKSFWEFRSAGV